MAVFYAFEVLASCYIVSLTNELGFINSTLLLDAIP